MNRMCILTITTTATTSCFRLFLFLQVVLCKFHSVFLSQKGQVFTCGHGQGGRLGHGDEQTYLVRTRELKFKIFVLSWYDNGRRSKRYGLLFFTVRSQDPGTLVLKTIDCWSLFCLIFIFLFFSPQVPRMVEGLMSHHCSQIAAAKDHTVVLTEEGYVYTFGLNTFHQLGLSPPPASAHVPKQVDLGGKVK